jgi:hypothetical protein
VPYSAIDRHFVFLADMSQTGRTELVEANSDGSEPTVVPAGGFHEAVDANGVDGYSLSPDGRDVAFTAVHCPVGIGAADLAKSAATRGAHLSDQLSMFAALRARLALKSRIVRPRRLARAASLDCSQRGGVHRQCW